jgi:Dynein heavy chain, N-terminal region 2
VEKLARDKHSGLLRKCVNYGQKKFYNIGPRSHLESIFIGSEDIRKQLPIDSERFDDIDTEFKQLMVTMSKTPNVVKVRHPGVWGQFYKTF